MDFDVIILGSGLAGLCAALRLGEKLRVAVVTKRQLVSGATALAQGGIAAVTAPDDNVGLHAADTIQAGAGLCHEDVVAAVIKDGPVRVAELTRWGVAFSRRGDGKYDLGMEGGHSRRRILHAADLTGQAIEEALIRALAERRNVTVYEYAMALDLIMDENGRCRGVYILETAESRVRTLSCKATILATGGAGKVFLITSNPDVATGDGVAIAWRAGATVANMEFYQFHPTCLFLPGARTYPDRSFLLSEALRGEGGTLLNERGDRFMPSYHEKAELAPRDVVARAIDAEMKKAGTDHVYLDCTAMGADKLRQRFPFIYAKCLEHNIDLAKDTAPVAPAAHYLCGGVRSDLDGRTDIPGLYAIGEVACTGLHGANRLASNSLLEAVVFATHAAQAAASEEKKRDLTPIPKWPYDATATHEPLAVSHDWYMVRRTMRDFVGIVRSDAWLGTAAERLAAARKRAQQLVTATRPDVDSFELLNIATVAELITRSAEWRRESRGLHFNQDHPARDDNVYLRDTVIKNDNVLPLIYS